LRLHRWRAEERHQEDGGEDRHMKHRASRHGWLARAEGSGLDRCRSINSYFLDRWCESGVRLLGTFL
jgi:hypothetical protein